MSPNPAMATTSEASSLRLSGQVPQEPVRPIRATRNPGISKEVLVVLRSKTGAPFQSRTFRSKPLTFSVRNIITGFLAACQKDPSRLRIAGVKWDHKLVATQLHKLLKSSPSRGRPVRKADVETWLRKNPYAQIVDEVLAKVKESATEMAQAVIHNDLNMDIDEDRPPVQATLPAQSPKGDLLLGASGPSLKPPSSDERITSPQPMTSFQGCTSACRDGIRLTDDKMKRNEGERGYRTGKHNKEFSFSVIPVWEKHHGARSPITVSVNKKYLNFGEAFDDGAFGKPPKNIQEQQLPVPSTPVLPVGEHHHGPKKQKKFPTFGEATRDVALGKPSTNVHGQQPQPPNVQNGSSATDKSAELGPPASSRSPRQQSVIVSAEKSSEYPAEANAVQNFGNGTFLASRSPAMNTAQPEGSFKKPVENRG